MIYKLALKYLKENKRKSWMMFITITIVAILISTLTAYTGLVKHNKLLDNIEKYGSYHYAVEEVTEEQTNMINNDPFVLETSNTYQYARFEYGNIGYVEDISLLPIRFIEGSMPTKDNEIAIEKSVLIQLGYEMKLNQTVTLDITDLEGNVRTQEYVISGIMEDYARYMITPALRIITPKVEEPVIHNQYVKVKSGDITLTGNNIRENFYISPRLDLVANIGGGNTSLIIFGVAILGAYIITLLFSTMNHTLEQRMMTLRGAGVTKAQVRQIIWLYTSFLAVPACVLATILSIGMNLILTIKDNLSFYYTLNMFIESTIILLLTVYVVATYRAVKLSQIGLTGKFIIKQSYLKVKKKHKLTPFFLAKRHLLLQKSKIILHVLIIWMMSIMATHMILKVMDDSISAENQINTLLRKEGISYYYEELEDYSPLLEDVKEIEGIDNVRVTLSYPSYPMGIPDRYMEGNEARGNPTMIDVWDDDKLTQLGLNKEAFYSGEEVCISLPQMYRLPSENGITDVAYEGYEPVKDTSINVGDQIKLYDKTVRVGAVIDSDDKLNIIYGPYRTRDDLIYRIYVAPNVIDQIPSVTNITIYPTDKKHVQDITTRMELISGSYSKKWSYINNFEMGEESKNNSQVEVTVAILCIGLILVIVGQRNIMNLESRKKELSTYLAIGMEESEVRKIIIFEGVWIVIIVSVVINFIEILTNQAFYRGYNSIYAVEGFIYGHMIHFCIMLMIILSYYFTTHLLMKEDLKKYVRYKE